MNEYEHGVLSNTYCQGDKSAGDRDKMWDTGTGLKGSLCELLI